MDNNFKTPDLTDSKQYPYGEWTDSSRNREQKTEKDWNLQDKIINDSWRTFGRDVTELAKIKWLVQNMGSDVQKVKEEINTIKENVKNVKSEKSTLISIFWIFASIVTFLSLEIQILKAVCDYKIFIWISFIIIWSLLFNVFLNLLWKEWLWENNNNMSKVEKIILWIAIILLIWWCGFSYLWDEQKCSEKKYLKFEADIRLVPK